MQNSDKLKTSIANTGIAFKVKVVPNSSMSKIVEINEEFIKIKLNSPPIENRANKEVVILLAKVFGIPKTSVEIVSGDKNKLKTFQIPISEEEFRKKLSEI